MEAQHLSTTRMTDDLADLLSLHCGDQEARSEKIARSVAIAIEKILMVMSQQSQQRHPSDAKQAAYTDSGAISVLEYITRLMLFYPAFSGTVLPYAIALFHRLSQSSVRIGPREINKAFSGCLLCATKIMTDVCSIELGFIGQVFGLCHNSVVQLEIQILVDLGFCLSLTPKAWVYYTVMLKWLFTSPTNPDITTEYDLTKVRI